MDILIKGMEMPNDCISCPFFDGSWCKAQPIDNWRTSSYSPPKGERQVTCPLVELPLHGRLIDADECGKVLLDKFTEGLGKWDEFYSAGYRYALKYFRQAPTIVEASE